MTKRWSPKRREEAERLWQAETTPKAAAKELGLPVTMVKQEFEELDKGVKKATPKKRSTKKAASPKKSKAAKSKGAAVPASKKACIDELITSINSQMNAEVIYRASESTTHYLLRRPTGILSLDIALGGGWPASALSVLTGPDGAGKDYLLDLTLAQQQRIHGEEFACVIYSTEFKFDKAFAREKAGFQVRMTPEELDDLDTARAQKDLPPLSNEEREHYQTQVGHVLLVDGIIADDGLDVVLDTVASNECQVVAINSLGVFQTAAKEEADSLRKHPQQSNEAQLLNRFMPNLFMLLNRKDKHDRRNQTTILATNQVRANRDMARGKPGMRTPERWKYVSGSGSRALKHGKAIELIVHNGSMHLDKEYKPPIALGKEVDWEVLKGKLGTHEGLKGSFDYWFDDGADILTDLINTGVRYGVIEKSGSWYSYQHNGEDITGQGARNLRVKLADRPDVLESIRNSCFKEAEVVCLYE
jgi:recombination protein RecA